MFLVISNFSFKKKAKEGLTVWTTAFPHHQAEAGTQRYHGGRACAPAGVGGAQWARFQPPPETWAWGARAELVSGGRASGCPHTLRLSILLPLLATLNPMPNNRCRSSLPCSIVPCVRGRYFSAPGPLPSFVTCQPKNTSECLAQV